MTAICPRCGAVSLAAAQATRFTCKTCHLRFCSECQHWKVECKQKYCARCGAYFSFPPPVMSRRVAAVVLYVPMITALFLMVSTAPQLWLLALIVIAPPLIYTSIYLALFYKSTGLTQAVRREALLLVRRLMMLAAIVYVVMALGDPAALIIGAVIVVILTLIGLGAQRANPAVIAELQANRSTWQALLSMSDWDVLLMRFPH